MRKPTNPFAQKRPSQPKAYKPPPTRDRLAEQILGRAIADKAVVTLIYDGAIRTFAPHVVWETSEGNVVVYGIQTSSSDPLSKNGSHNFTVAKMQNLRLTGDHFTKDPAFDTGKYRDRVLYIIQGF